MPATVHRSPVSEFGTITDQVGIKASVKTLYEARKRMLFYRFGMEEDMAKNSSTTLNFRRWMNIAPVTAPIQGSTTPDPATQSYKDVTSTLRQYGIWVPQPKYISDTISDPVLTRAINALGYNMRSCYETIAFNTLRMGTSVFYADGTLLADRSSVGTGAGKGAITLNLIRSVVEYFEGRNVEPITELIQAKTLVATEPVEEAYIFVMHSDLARSIRDLPGFEPASKYPDQKSVLPLELGRVENARFVRHNFCVPWKGAGAAELTVKNTAGNADVYPVLVFGKEAFGCSKLKGSEFNKVLVANAEVTAQDPLGQRGTAGWSGWNAYKILENDYMTRLEVTSPK